MKFHKGLGLVSDEVAVKSGYDGNEPKELISSFSRISKEAKLNEGDMVRTTIAVNTVYFEIQGGYYINKSIISLVQKILNNLGLSVVIWDVYSENKVVPIEEYGSLDVVNEEYLLVNINREKAEGILIIWSFQGDDSTPYYEGNIILDLLMQKSTANAFKVAFKEKCMSEKIKYIECCT